MVAADVQGRWFSFMTAVGFGLIYGSNASAYLVRGDREAALLSTRIAIGQMSEAWNEARGLGPEWESITLPLIDACRAYVTLLERQLDDCRRLRRLDPSRTPSKGERIAIDAGTWGLTKAWTAASVLHETLGGDPSAIVDIETMMNSLRCTP
jgi:hypothetical protein